MSQWRKKPVVVEAVQITADMVLDDCLPEGVSMGAAEYHRGNRTVSMFRGNIKTLEGEMTCGIGDWVIKGIEGELYPCKPDIFAMTYEPVPPSPQEPG